jgi:hypothetical protein
MKSRSKLAAVALGALLFLQAALIFTSTCTFTGCATKLDPAGPYATNNSPAAALFLLLSDKTLVDSKDTLNVFLTWELQNRSTLATVAPNVTKVADTIRDQAPLYFTNAYLLRSNYVFAFNSQPGASSTASNFFSAAVQTISALAMSSSQLTNTIPSK